MDFDRFEWIFVGVVHCQTVGSVDEWKTILLIDDVWRFVALFSCDGVPAKTFDGSTYAKICLATEALVRAT